ATAAMSVILSGVFDRTEYPYRTMTPASTISMGISNAHRNPMTDCLYLIRMSRYASVHNNSLYWTRSASACRIDGSYSPSRKPVGLGRRKANRVPRPGTRGSHGPTDETRLVGTMPS